MISTLSTLCPRSRSWFTRPRACSYGSYLARMARIEVGYRMSDGAKNASGMNPPRSQCMTGSSIQSQNQDRRGSNYSTLSAMITDTSAGNTYTQMFPVMAT